MHIGRFEFRPGLIPSLATLLVLPVLVSLGFWQLQRAEFKARLSVERDDALQGMPVALQRLKPDWEQGRYHRVEAHGRYLPDRQVLLDNQILHGRPGYWVLTPFQPEGLDQLILVNRGWVPMDADRNRLPQLAVHGDIRSVIGYLDRPPRPGIRLGESLVSREGWPLVMLEVDYDELRVRLGQPLVPMLLQLSEQAEDGFERDWRVTAGFGPDTHRGYALQWFSLAAVLTLLYLGLNIRRRPAKG
jgi:surfeit locus 1 family protein